MMKPLPEKNAVQTQFILMGKFGPKTINLVKKNSFSDFISGHPVYCFCLTISLPCEIEVFLSDVNIAGRPPRAGENLSFQ